MVACVAACRINFDPVANDGAVGIDATLAPITFVQVQAFDSNSNFATITVTFPQPQQPGNVDVAVVAWGDVTGNVATISDTAGNSYTRAIGPTLNTCDAQSIYYAPNIAAAASNTVTVTFDKTITFPTLLMLEYSGIATAHQSIEGTGSTVAASTPPVATTAARALVFGAGVPDNCAPPDFQSEGVGFNRRIITPVSGMLGEDIITTQTGAFAAAGDLTAASPWVMQTVVFE